MKTAAALAALLALAAPLGAIELETAWAYHAADADARTAELVPGESFAFLAHETAEVSTSEPVVLHVLTAREFAGDLDEQVVVRWWDGTRALWVMGSWVKNVALDAAADRFRDLPDHGAAVLDLWRVEIPAELTRPGDNYYAIQIKGIGDGVSEARYLLARGGGDFTRTNALGQIWSASEEFDKQDWRVSILPEPPAAD